MVSWTDSYGDGNVPLGFYVIHLRYAAVSDFKKIFYPFMTFICNRDHHNSVDIPINIPIKSPLISLFIVQI
jgi:hypothetical protein